MFTKSLVRSIASRMEARRIAGAADASPEMVPGTVATTYRVGVASASSHSRIVVRYNPDQRGERRGTAYAAPALRANVRQHFTAGGSEIIEHASAITLAEALEYAAARQPYVGRGALAETSHFTVEIAGVRVADGRILAQQELAPVAERMATRLRGVLSPAAIAAQAYEL